MFFYRLQYLNDSGRYAYFRNKKLIITSKTMNHTLLLTLGCLFWTNLYIINTIKLLGIKSQHLFSPKSNNLDLRFWSSLVMASNNWVIYRIKFLKFC
jgi:hypothetical protein